ncbi:putative sugar nucleotidyl transferase [Muribaculum sp.]|uniref:putative sugar nucleotidyl transferase n=1 Tax=Muribaculum sp. TaxID=1918611 RepID=UPI0023C85D66|nr:putative sugar nucleotidyl transferase [Muribaculum sp.]MDE5704672.1 glucose-1-phosphate thymidylyltransferase [Muribaculum sp.]MDE5923191.1 glucose-1-phosphate thymidylyltransferase [Muribaculum sp.]
MRNIILYDVAEVHDNLLPITYTRPVAGIRLGIDTIREKWERAFPGEYSYKVSAEYLAPKFPMKEADTLNDYYIASHICPSDELVRAIEALPAGCRLTAGGEEIARHGKEATDTVEADSIQLTALRSLTDIFTLNGEALVTDFERVTAGRVSQPVSDTVTIIGDPSRVFIEEGAWVEAAVLNVQNGPIYIGRNAEIMEGTLVRGPLALCHDSHINMGTRVYGATTIGPWCKVGGELSNVVMLGYSNKAHDGFLGNAVIGEWCNLGAGCVASNLKNDYTEIKLWNYPAHRFLRTGLQFCGLIMADHSKAGINTMFNTATVVGVGCNIHGSGFPRNFVASFSEGGAAGFSDVTMSKFFDIARRAMARRHVELTQTDIDIFEAIRDIAETYK